MYNIQMLNKIAKVGTDNLDPAKYTLGTEMDNPDAILVRSAVMHDMELGSNLKAIARAGAGVNNIPVDACTEKGIVVFNTPGANANGVKEMTLCALFLAARNVVGGIEWAKGLTGDDVAKQVEKGKSAFAGTELKGKTLGVIGLGAIGGMVANVAVHLGMKVIGCDPFLSVEGAWNLNHHVVKAATYDEIFEKADYITLHVPATKDTKGMINATTIATMKDGVRLINLSRADLVNAADVAEAMKSGKMAAYVTDFPTAEVLEIPGVVAIPHLGASTEESEDNCAVMAALELDDYLTNGNIKNSVNFPPASMPRSGDCRICLFNANVPEIITAVTKIVGEGGRNIENMMNKSRGNVAYTIMDVIGDIDDATVAQLEAIEGVFGVRVIK
ncbi:MAG: 3-phosphoglycerate dehydrogenase [Clostridia bacterium]|nr:3-phosphoglycerate dehydrogenase [Clostridia bacterium]